ncbi:MAG: hypothetical protein BWX75_01352 [Candidatus Cloacimonetes bacterium ADurb.Bin088]|nr:MAG: hypothetical protein BWX75_01352 [Candidatus Cloacimonetes bacterium ADurb.Bin088]
MAVKSSSSRMRTWLSAASTIALALTPYLATSSLGSEPLFTPMRMGTPRSAARRTTSATFSREPILPGLMRKPSMPASRAARASLWSKWMSATRGTAATLFNAGMASASAWFITEKRMISQPAFSNWAICRAAASTFAVGTQSMLWMDMGASPPMASLPRRI